MSTSDSTRLPEPQQNHLSLPEFYTAHSGAPIARCTPPTLRAHGKPDAWTWNAEGTRRFPLFSRRTLEAFAIELREAQGGAA